MFDCFQNAQPELHIARPEFGPAVRDVLSKARFARASAEIRSWSGYRPTPLIELAGIASALNVSAVHYKHEAARFGLGSFKALGGAYAVLRVLQDRLTTQLGHKVSFKDIHTGKYSDRISLMTVVSATDGNHGRSVAWGARRFGAQCRIYIHAEVSASREEAIRALGAKVIRVNGDYDAAVAQCRWEAERYGWFIVSDTSWQGYSEIPKDVMAGYGVMAREITSELTEPATHVFLQGGVGGLAAAVASTFYQHWGSTAPLNVVVEPELASCLMASAKNKSPTAVRIQRETLMAGLSCGEPSELAWDILEQSVSAYMTIPDDLVAPAIKLLASGQSGDTRLKVGESAVAGLIGLFCGALNPKLRDRLKLTPESRIIIIGSEGVTDPEMFHKMVTDDLPMDGTEPA